MALPLSSASLQFSSSSRPSFSSNQSLSVTSSSFIPPVPSVSSYTISVSARSPIIPVTCGRGDRKTKRGKRFAHSYGNARPRNKTKGTGPARAPTPPNPYKKVFVPPADDEDYEDFDEKKGSDAIPDDY